MGTKRTYKAEAADPKAGMTISELRQFMASIDGLQTGKVKVRVNMTGGVKWIEVTEGPHEGAMVRGRDDV